MKKINNYLNSLIGQKTQDTDGVYGVQCVDLIKRYLKEHFDIPPCSLGDGMYVAKNVAMSFNADFMYIPYTDTISPQVGDIISFHSSSSPNCGHVAIVNSDYDGKNYGIIEQWNGSGTIKTNTKTVQAPKRGVSYTVIGLARPIQNGISDSEPINPFPVPAQNIKKGSKGDSVKWLQFELVSRKHDIGKCGIDGIFGTATDSAVRKFQKDNGLTVDGIVGVKTRGKLKA